MGGSRYHLRLLGFPRVETADGERSDLAPGKPLALLAYVSLAGEPPSRDELAVLLWPGSSRRRARGSLRQALWQLRKSLGEEIFAGDDPVRLAEDVLRTDVDEFRDRVAAGDLEGALELWEGCPLDQLRVPDSPEWERWADQLRRELEQRFGGALSDRGNRARETGSGQTAVRWLRLARQVQPYRLQHHLDLAEALLDLRAFNEVAGALAEARQQFEDPKSAEELDAMEARLEAVRRGAADGSRSPGSGLRLRFTGRTEEFSTLIRRWRQVREGDTAVGLVLGEAGIGKTRLAEEVALLVRSEGGRVVKVKAEDSERPIEWGLLGELVDSLLRLSGAAGIASGSEDMLRTLVPSLPRTGDAVPGPRRTEGHPLTFPRTRPSAALSDALQDLVEAVAEDAPLLVVVDDLQWADTESRAVLTRVASRMRETPVFVLLTSRTGAGEVSPRMRKTLALLSRAAGDALLELKPLSSHETRELLESTIEAPEHSDVQGVVDRIIRTSRGNPLFIVELLKVLQDEGVLVQEKEGEWSLRAEQLPADFPLPASLRELIDRQLSNLSQEASLVAAHLATARHPVAPRVLAGRAGLGPSALTSGVSELVERRMVQWEPGEKLAFAHDELRAAVSRRFQLHVGLTTGGGTQWSLFRTAVAASLALLLLSAATYLATGGSFPSAPSLGGGPLLIVLGPDSVLEARGAFNSPTGTWRIEALDDATQPSTANGELLANGGEAAPSLGHLPAGGETRILEVVPGDAGGDSARVLRPDRGVVDARLWERIHGASWCGGTPPSLLLSVSGEEGAELLLWRPETGEAESVPLPGLPGSVLACAPDGRYAAVLAADGGDLSVQVVDLRDGTSTALPIDGTYRIQEMVWPPDRPAPVPVAVRIGSEGEQVLDWGERTVLNGAIERSDGTSVREGLSWISRDPGVASVGPSGVLTANRPGTTWVVASFDGWLADSIAVRVRETGSTPRVLLWDPLPPLGDGVWETDESRNEPETLSPEPFAESYPASEPAWRSVDGFALPAGGTLEMEFVLLGEGSPLRACLAREVDGAPAGGREGGLCLTLHQVRGEPKDGELHFHPSFPAVPVAAPSSPSSTASGGWRHLALALLPDGTGVAYLDRTEVARTPARLPLEGPGRWHVYLQGIQLEAEGAATERGFRNVLLWPDVRF